MTSRKYGTKPNLNAQKRTSARRSWVAPEYEPVNCCDCCGKPAELTFSVSYGIDTWACEECRDPHRVFGGAYAIPVFGTRNESGYSREELVRDKAREDARTIDNEDV